MTKPVLRFGFADFWPHFDRADNWFTHVLSRAYDLRLSATPDVLLYADFGGAHLDHRGVRIYFSGENRHADWRVCDYALTSQLTDHPRHHRLLIHAVERDLGALVGRRVDAERALTAKTGFCAFVYSNHRCEERNRFFEVLSRYKPVDSGGRLFNNVGGPVADKAAFLRSRKFTIAYENSSVPGYTTEKLYDPLAASSVPLYWGNEHAGRDFNTRAFLSRHEFPSDEAFVEAIVALDENDDRYLAMLREPAFPDDRLPDDLEPERVLDFLQRAIADPRRPVASRPTARAYVAGRHQAGRVGRKLRRVAGRVRRR